MEGRKIHFKLGSGDSIFLWHDSWHPLGPMFEKFGLRALYDLASGIISFRVNIEWLMEAALARYNALIKIQNCWLILNLVEADDLCIPFNNGVYSWVMEGYLGDDRSKEALGCMVESRVVQKRSS